MTIGTVWGLALDPGEGIDRKMDERQHGCTGGLSTHRAMANYRTKRRHNGTIAHRAAESATFKCVGNVHASRSNSAEGRFWPVGHSSFVRFPGFSSLRRRSGLKLQPCLREPLPGKNDPHQRAGLEHRRATLARARLVRATLHTS